MRSLMKRLEAVEARNSLGDDMPSCIKFQVLSATGEQLPVLGWREMHHDKPAEVYRHPGESDEDLEARAVATFKESPWRQPGSVPVMVAITEDTIDRKAAK